MSDATYIELPPQPRKRKSLFRGWRGAVLLLFLIAAALAGCFSWWLSEGKISSSFARVDTVSFTVSPDYTTRVNQILVYQGQEVQPGQPLAMIDADPNAAPATTQAPNPAGLPGLGEITGRLNATQETERRISARLAQARTEEERYQKAHQDRVAEHVHSQLNLRAVDPGNVPMYERARQMEAAARSRMETAREQFENVSKSRAAMETELDRIRIEIARKRLRRGVSREIAAPQPQAPAPPREESLQAPVAGKIYEVNARPGQTVYGGQPLFLILPKDQNNDSWIQAWFPMSAQHMLKPGQQANIKAGSLHFVGRVSAISPEAQYLPVNGSGQQYSQFLPVRIQVDDPEKLAKLAPGANVECQIQTRYVIDQTLF